MHGAPGRLRVPPEVTRRLAHVRTRLDRFDEREQCTLNNWGYAVCDAATEKALVVSPKSSVFR